MSSTAGRTAGPQPEAVDHATRRDRLRDRVRDLDLDAILLTEAVNVQWATGFTGSNGQLLLGADGDDLLITDVRYDERADREAPGLDRELDRDPIGVACARLRRPRLGFEQDALSWREGQRLREAVREIDGRAEPTSGLVEDLRAVKDAHEVDLLRRACAITTEALAWLLDEYVEVGRTELELGRALEHRFVEMGADGAAFASIVASGPNAAIPHHAPGRRVLERGDVLTIDCGARVEGYHADCTRTVAIAELAEPLVSVHEVVRRAQQAGRDAALAGATGGDVDAAARDVIEEAGHGESFLHGTGHGVGLEVHERPAVARGSAATLVAGMTLTVEPGIYLSGVGGVRIEDTVVVTADGPARPLTDLPRALRLL